MTVTGAVGVEVLLVVVLVVTLVVVELDEVAVLVGAGVTPFNTVAVEPSGQRMVAPASS
jgi:hypothetical protein